MGFLNDKNNNGQRQLYSFRGMLLLRGNIFYFGYIMQCTKIETQVSAKKMIADNVCLELHVNREVLSPPLLVFLCIDCAKYPGPVICISLTWLWSN